MLNRQKAIKSKGFAFNFEKDTNLIDPNQDAFTPIDFSKIKVGAKTLSDAILDLGLFKETDVQYTRKQILNAVEKRDIETMRSISNYFFAISGIYSRLCRYLAYMYRYDWMVTPYINEDTAKVRDEDTALQAFYKILLFLDKSELKRLFGKIALRVIVDGCYYGYLKTSSNQINLQDLPITYCRSRFTVNDRPVIEFNMKYFDATFKDTEQRMKMLEVFPEEFKKGYILYKQGKLPPQFQGDTEG